jgi:predicted nuclease of restriction endonuclease-like (RecB) superfamily
VTGLPENISLAIREIKSAIVKAQSRVAANANAEMLSLYFGIGRYVSYKTQTEKWGTGVIDTISAQLQKEMPGLRGFGARNIRNMRQFYEKWAEDLIWETPSAKLESEYRKGESQPPAPASNDLPAVDGVVWPSPTAKLETAGGMTVTVAEFLSISFSHHMEILSGSKPLEERLFYVHEAALRHFNLDQLRDSIKRDDFHHRGAMPSNFTVTIPDAALARKTLAMFRDEYLLDFVNLDDIEAATGEDVDERVADLSKAIYNRYFEFAEDLERRAKGHPNFQYIITTTESPPERFTKEPYLCLKLDASMQEGRLLKCNLN